MTDPSPWWDRDVYADRRPFLLARGRILSALRDWFRRRGFLEVETPALQVSPGNEVHLHAFATELTTPGGARQPLYLHTSPEFTCKKLLAAGEGRVFSLSHVFRNRERGPLHHPEFTMLEWYRTNEPYETLMADCAAIVLEAAKAAGSQQLQWKRPQRRSLRRSRAAERRRRVSDIRRHRPAGDDGRRDGRHRQARRGGEGGRRPDRRRRHLVGHFQPRAGGADRAPARPWPADRARPLSVAGGGVGAARRRSAAGAALRALRLRRRARQRLRRDHRRHRAARQIRGGDGGAAAPLRRAISDRRRFPEIARRRCRRRAASRSASTGW